MRRAGPKLYRAGMKAAAMTVHLRVVATRRATLIIPNCASGSATPRRVAARSTRAATSVQRATRPTTTPARTPKANRRNAASRFGRTCPTWRPTSFHDLPMMETSAFHMAPPLPATAGVFTRPRVVHVPRSIPCVDCQRSTRYGFARSNSTQSSSNRCSTPSASRSATSLTNDATRPMNNGSAERMS